MTFIGGIKDFGMGWLSKVMPTGRSKGSVEQEQRALAAKNGIVLQNHCRSAHGGEYEPNCAACVELKAKMEKTK